MLKYQQHHCRHHLHNSIEDYKRLSLIHFAVMSRVVKNNRGFLQLLADWPKHQRQFLLRTATPQQTHALIQVLYIVLKQCIPVPEENRQKFLLYKDTLFNLAEPDFSYRKKKHILVKEGNGFIQELLTPVISSMGFLLLQIQ